MLPQQKTGLLIRLCQEDTEPAETDSEYFHFLQDSGTDLRLGGIKLEPGAEEASGETVIEDEKDRIKKDNHNKSKRTCDIFGLFKLKI